MTGVDPGLLRDDLAALYPQFGVTVAHAGLLLAPPTDPEPADAPGDTHDPGDEARTESGEA